ncbi:LacI family DNA-binding transcriptional regulator [Vibrio ziniensis]|uniref:LacI family transcriptional regulator n=1 Tax=Vibrio ziniensis TaxID=2711221 RepID=A0A6G7CJK8_9VIBR|nr:LacI family DNA-binding transcriptional regulator [Vibrio ziniensis]QIH42233.1 LacI family transcriptional regulator [Vibrio ziniensis]
MSNIRDVSELAGVSKATVSRVVNGKNQVKQETRDKVYAAMEQLGYRPNKLAQALAKSKTDSIGFVVSNYDGGYVGDMLKQASLSAAKANKSLIVTDSQSNPEQEYEAVLQLEGRCDAIVLYSRTLCYDQIQKLYQHLSTPMVLMNLVIPEQLFHTVSFDQEGAVETMMEHLIRCGHKNIACITGKVDNPTGRARLAGYKNTLLKHGLVYSPDLVRQADYLIDGAYFSCREMIEHSRPFTAVIAFNDYMALGAMKALTEAGIQVPQQVSVAGIDNHLIATYTTPTLTTIELPLKEMTDQAIDIAVQLSNEYIPPRAHRYTGKLVVRNSVARVMT